jgi:TonB family protein
MGVGAILRSSISLSIAVHVLFFLFCSFLLSRQTSVVSPSKMTWVELQPDVSKHLEKKNAEVRRQIVQSVKAEKTKEAPDQAFLGEQNQRVDRQTVGRQRMPVMGAQQEAPRAKPKTPEQELAEIGREKPLSKFGLPIIPSGGERTPAAERWAEQGRSPQDYVKGIRESDRTALNTKEFIFFGYFQRIRERLDRAWVPILRQRLTKFYRSGRQLASDRDHTTRVLVILNKGGEIVRVRIMGESGTRDLDDAAVRAFNEAGPFPNPPKGIVNATGEIEIPWEFVLKT